MSQYLILLNDSVYVFGNLWCSTWLQLPKRSSSGNTSENCLRFDWILYEDKFTSSNLPHLDSAVIIKTLRFPSLFIFTLLTLLFCLSCHLFSSQQMGFPIGALLIGSFVSSCLFGVIIVQVQHYFEHYTNDKLLVKLTVCDWIPLLASTYSYYSGSVSMGTWACTYNWHSIWRLHAHNSHLTVIHPSRYLCSDAHERLDNDDRGGFPLIKDISCFPATVEFHRNSRYWIGGCTLRGSRSSSRKAFQWQQLWSKYWDYGSIAHRVISHCCSHWHSDCRSNVEILIGEEKHTIAKVCFISSSNGLYSTYS